jgi:hypothetical protein
MRFIWAVFNYLLFAGTQFLFTHKIGQTYTDDAGTMAAVVASYQGDGQLAVDGSVANGATVEFVFPITVAKLISVGLYSDQAVTIHTNSNSVPDDSVSLAAKQLVAWANDHAEDAPFSVDVTSLYVHNASGSTANVKFHACVDASV